MSAGGLRWFWLMCLLLLSAVPAARAAQDAQRFEAGASSITVEGRDWGRPRPLDIRLGVSGPVPYRVYFLDDPARLIVDFKGLDFGAADPAGLRGVDLVPALRWGRFRPGWSRLVAELPGPYALAEALQTPAAGQGATIRLRLKPVRPGDFVTRKDALNALWDLPEPSIPRFVPRGSPGEGRPLRVALDPGHGGIDPGAQVGPITEAAAMLGFSHELTRALQNAGIEVVATRSDDRFVSLERRMTLARAGRADLFISLHADSLPEGQAAGVAIYVWDRQADDRAARELAARHDRADLLAGVDLDGADDQVAAVLMDLARLDTQPRSQNFAGMLVSEMALREFDMHRVPIRRAAFSVLKSPDIPSVLIELGFLTDPTDRANLFDPKWRRRMADSITRAVLTWAEDERVRAGLLRK